MANITLQTTQGYGLGAVQDSTRGSSRHYLKMLTRAIWQQTHQANSTSRHLQDSISGQVLPSYQQGQIQIVSGLSHRALSLSSSRCLHNRALSLSSSRCLRHRALSLSRSRCLQHRAMSLSSSRCLHHRALSLSSRSLHHRALSLSRCKSLHHRALSLSRSRSFHHRALSLSRSKCLHHRALSLYSSRSLPPSSLPAEKKSFSFQHKETTTVKQSFWVWRVQWTCSWKKIAMPKKTLRLFSKDIKELMKTAFDWGLCACTWIKLYQSDNKTFHRNYATLIRVMRFLCVCT